MRRNPAACSNVLGPMPGTAVNCTRERNRPVFIAELDDLLRGAFGDAGDVAQQRPGRRVEIHAHAVDAAFDHRFERFVQLALIDVVLILADADGFRVELDQLRQRVLQTARDGDGAAHGEIEVGKFLARDVGSGINGSAGFVDRHAEDRRAVLPS